jgi:hypothetical protein
VRQGLQQAAVAKALHLLADINPQGLGDPLGLGDDEHGFLQVAAVAVLQCQELLRGQVQAIGQFCHADAASLPGPPQSMAKVD